MQQKHMSAIEQNLQLYNNGKVGKDEFVASIYDALLVVLPNGNTDKYDLRQEVCTQLLSGVWQFANVEMLVHYVRAIAGNMNKASYRILSRQAELSDQYIADDSSRQYNAVQASLYGGNGIGHQFIVNYATKKSIAELIKEKGDYRITELAKLLGVSRQYVYKMIKTNYAHSEIYFKLKAVRPYNMLEAHKHLKLCIYNSFGKLQNATFKRLGINRAHFYKCSAVGVRYTVYMRACNALCALG